MQKNNLGLVSPDSNQLTHTEPMLHSMLKEQTYQRNSTGVRKQCISEQKARGRGENFLNSANALKTGNASRITQAPTRNSEEKVEQASEIFCFLNRLSKQSILRAPVIYNLDCAPCRDAHQLS